MIEELYQSVAETLKRVDDRPVYVEDIPQKFAMPSWLVEITPLALQRGINGRRKTSASVNISYFVEDKNKDKNLTCISVGEALGRFDMVGEFHVSERNITIVDGVLHFGFTVNYTEAPINTDSTMQTMDYGLANKEE